MLVVDGLLLESLRLGYELFGLVVDGEGDFSEKGIVAVNALPDIRALGVGVSALQVDHFAIYEDIYAPAATTKSQDKMQC